MLSYVYINVRHHGVDIVNAIHIFKYAGFETHDCVDFLKSCIKCRSVQKVMENYLMKLLLKKKKITDSLMDVITTSFRMCNILKNVGSIYIHKCSKLTQYMLSYINICSQLEMDRNIKRIPYNILRIWLRFKSKNWVFTDNYHWYSGLAHNLHGMNAHQITLFHLFSVRPEKARYSHWEVNERSICTRSDNDTYKNIILCCLMFILLCFPFWLSLFLNVDLWQKKCEKIKLNFTLLMCCCLGITPHRLTATTKANLPFIT